MSSFYNPSNRLSPAKLGMITLAINLLKRSGGILYTAHGQGYRDRTSDKKLFKAYSTAA